MAIESPNYTQTPNDIFDIYMKNLTGAELKVLLVITRKTFGWNKKKDKISLSQIMEMSGLSKRQIIRAKKTLNELHDLIISTGDERGIGEFAINISGDKSAPGENTLVTKVYQSGDKSIPDKGKSGDKSIHTKDNIKDTNKKILHNEIKDYFQSANPHYYHDGKQAQAIDNLIKRFDYDKSKIYDIIHKHAYIIKKDIAPFWCNDPHTPLVVLSKIDRIFSWKVNSNKNKMSEIQHKDFA